MFNLITQVWAEGPAVPGGVSAAGASASQQPGVMGMIFPFILMFGVVYFLMIRPQQKKLKEQQSMIEALKDGDEVVTSSGILGTIAGINEKIVTLEISKGVKVKLVKSQVTQVVKGTLNV